MTSFSGQFEYVDAHGAHAGEGPCGVTVDGETLAIAPAQGGALVFDLGDIDSVSAAEYRLTVRLYTGATLVLRALGKALQTVDHVVRMARRDRFVACLLLADLPERARFEGFAEWSSAESAFSGPAEIRLYETNVAILPDAAAGIQWRLADVDDVQFDATRYAVAIRAGHDMLTVSKLARRTEEFRQRLTETMAAVAVRSGQALLDMLPFLSPDQLAQVTSIMKEGRTSAVSDLAAVDTRIESALLVRTVGKSHRLYIDALLKRAVPGSLRIGFKLLDPDRPVEGEADEPAGSENTGAPPSAAGTDPGEDEALGDTPAVFWLFAPLASREAVGNARLAAWEPTTGSGRATYLFRLDAGGTGASGSGEAALSVVSEIERLNRGLLSVNFRREPIYLDDDALARTPAYRRYVIATRRLPELRRLRAAFTGRAIHSSLERWTADLDAIMARS